jgi:hypothetical protein
LSALIKTTLNDFPPLPDRITFHLKLFYVSGVKFPPFFPLLGSKEYRIVTGLKRMLSKWAPSRRPPEMEGSCKYTDFPLAYEYRKYVENRN